MRSPEREWDLVAIANAAHWIDREVMQTHLGRVLTTDGTAVIVTRTRFLAGQEPWKESLRRHLSQSWRVPEAQLHVSGGDYGRSAVRGLGLDRHWSAVIPHAQSWTLETLTGFLVSSSFVGQQMRTRGFEAALKDLEEWWSRTGLQNEVRECSDFILHGGRKAATC